jgi:hypothetical protein
MILYISQRSAVDPGFGKTKLNKLLRKIDFTAFVELGEPVTGAEYTRQDFGPCPRLFKPVWEQLKLLGHVTSAWRPIFKHRQERPVPRRQPNLSEFSQDQLELVNRMITEDWGKSAKQMSNETHGRVWKAARYEGVPIPYESVYVSDDPLTREDIERTREVARLLGW